MAAWYAANLGLASFVDTHVVLAMLAARDGAVACFDVLFILPNV